MKYIKMLHVKDDIEVTIIVNENVISINNKDGQQLYFKMVKRGDVNEVNSIISSLINNHFDRGYVITKMDVFG